MESYTLTCTPVVEDAIHVLRLSGYLNDQTVQDFEATVEDLPQANPFVVVDAAEAIHISSIGFGALLALTSELRARNGDLRIANLNPSLQRVLTLAFAGFFQTFASTREAIASYHAVSAN